VGSSLGKAPISHAALAGCGMPAPATGSRLARPMCPPSQMESDRLDGEPFRGSCVKEVGPSAFPGSRLMTTRKCEVAMAQDGNGLDGRPGSGGSSPSGSQSGPASDAQPAPSATGSTPGAGSSLGADRQFLSVPTGGGSGRVRPLFEIGPDSGNTSASGSRSPSVAPSPAALSRIPSSAAVTAVGSGASLGDGAASHGLSSAATLVDSAPPRIPNFADLGRARGVGGVSDAARASSSSASMSAALNGQRSQGVGQQSREPSAHGHGRSTAAPGAGSTPAR